MNRFVSVFRFALLHLWRDANRNFLCAIAIAIGMAAVVALSIVSRSAATQAIEAYKDMAVDLFTITVPAIGAFSYSEISAQRQIKISNNDDVSALLLAVNTALASYDPVLQTIANVHAMQVFKCQLVSKDFEQSVQIATAAPKLLGRLGFSIAEGRDLIEHDSATEWMVLGARIAAELRRHGGVTLQVGRPVRLCNTTYYLAGILRATAEREYDQWQDTVFVLPSSSGLKKYKLESVDVVIHLPGRLDIENVIPFVSGYLGIQSDSPITIKSAAKMIELRKQHINQHSKLIFLIGAISVLIGGLAVMNVMQMSIIERRYDIAVCMAVGADKPSIFLQFFFESATLGLFGGLLGSVLGVLLSFMILASQGMPSVGWIDVVTFACVLSTVVGTVSGLFPSLKVSRTQPAIVLAT